MVKTLVADTLHPLEPVYKRTMQDIQIQSGRVPNVTGMGAKDAVFAMESAGAKVKIYGKGAVISQSQPPGVPVSKTTIIELYLR
jgi:cell division protein FtsI (penicillin-binding protein 3)